MGSPDPAEEVRPADLRSTIPVARRLLASGGRAFGLFPVRVGLALGPLATGLAEAIGQLTGGTVAKVPPWAAWQEHRDVPGAPAIADVLIPVAHARGAAAVLSRAVPVLGSRSAAVLIDLTGFDSGYLRVLGGLLRIALVVPAGGIREGQLMRIVRDLPPQVVAGVVLID